MEEQFARFWGDLADRLGGPLDFRFFLQPAIALFFGIRDGLRDAQVGARPYFWAIFTDPAERRPLVRHGWKSIAKVVAVALVLDVAYQLLVLRFVYPVEALVVAIGLAILPYLLSRGPINRIVRAWGHRGRAH